MAHSGKWIFAKLSVNQWLICIEKYNIWEVGQAKFFNMLSVGFLKPKHRYHPRGLERSFIRQVSATEQLLSLGNVFLPLWPCNTMLRDRSYVNKSKGWYKKDVTPVLTPWSYIFHALTHRNGLLTAQYKPCHMVSLAHFEKLPAATFCWYGLTLSPAWISNNTHYKVWDKIIHPFPNFTSATIELWVALMKFGNGEVISPHTLLCMQLLIHSMI